MPKPQSHKPRGNKPKAEKPYRTALGVSHGMAERPRRQFELEPVGQLDPELVRR
jgi:hypothetical protein